MSSLRPAHVVWLAVYLALAAGVVWGMVRLRSQVIATYSTPQQQVHWQQWRDAAGSEPAGGVERQVPKSNEPPALVLMRDYFAMCLAASLVFTSLLFAVTVFLMIGAFRRPAADDEPPDCN